MGEQARGTRRPLSFWCQFGRDQSTSRNLPGEESRGCKGLPISQSVVGEDAFDPVSPEEHPAGRIAERPRIEGAAVRRAVRHLARCRLVPLVVRSGVGRDGGPWSSGRPPVRQLLRGGLEGGCSRFRDRYMQILYGESWVSLVSSEVHRRLTRREMLGEPGFPGGLRVVLDHGLAQGQPPHPHRRL